MYDGAPHASTQTLDIAKSADLILLPVGASKFDLDPQIMLAHEMVKHGIEQKRIPFVLCRLVASDNERQAVAEYIGQTPFKLLPGFLAG